MAFLPAAPTTPKYQPRPADAAMAIAGAQDYLHMLRANGVTGEIDPAEVAQAWQALQNMPSAKTTTLAWDAKGPDNYGGRTRALLVDKNNSASCLRDLSGAACLSPPTAEPRGMS